MLSVKILKFLLYLAIPIIIAAIGYEELNRSDASIPVLNYHHISEVNGNALILFPEQFEAQMKYLAEEGYTTITPTELLDSWENGTPLPPKPIIITFDDGYKDNYTEAYPILKKYNLKATIFLVTGVVSAYPSYLTWEDVNEMQSSGLINFESHTITHSKLNEITSLDDLWAELLGSREIIESHTKAPVTFIAYPYGSVNERIAELTKAAGYRAAFLVDFGLTSPADNRYDLKRIPIFGSNTHTLMRFKFRLRFPHLTAAIMKLQAWLKTEDYTILYEMMPQP